MRKYIVVASFLLALFSCTTFAQTVTPSSSTSTDVFIMPGFDVVTNNGIRLNFNVGIGHTFGFLHKDPFGDELTASYTYENGGNHGFFHSDFGTHTVNVGVMRNFSLKKVSWLSFYTWQLIGNTSITGCRHVENRLYLGVGGGAVIHFDSHDAIWIQETWNKVLTFPGYPSTNIGYAFSF
jgi:hypothetical protein